MRFEFATAGRILFGPGTFEEAGTLAKTMGQKALVLTRESLYSRQFFLDRLTEAGVTTAQHLVHGEPTTNSVAEATEIARKSGCDMVIALGGGSVIDTGKAVSALLANPGDLLDYLEVIGAGKPLLNPAVPCIAIPTTAGTGAEVTRNAVIHSPEHHVKVSMRSYGMLPRLAIIDPLLTRSMPPSVTASTGLDALTQNLEAFVSVKANPLTDGFCIEGMMRASRSLRRAYDDGEDAAAREHMALASLLGGLALANAGLGAVHGFASVLGGMYSAPHGLVCAALLPHVVERNIFALQIKKADCEALRRYAEVAAILTGKPDAHPLDGVGWVRELCAHLDVPGLKDLNVCEDDFPKIVEQSQKASSMKGNPIPLTDEELALTLQNAFLMLR